MTGFIEGVPRGQTLLFPDRLDDRIGEDDLVRVVALFVNGLICWPSDSTAPLPRGPGGRAIIQRRF